MSKIAKRSAARPASKRTRAQVIKRKLNHSAGNMVMTLLAVGAAGVVGYLGWTYYRNKRNKKNSTTLLPASLSLVNASSAESSNYLPATDSITSSSLPAVKITRDNKIVSVPTAGVFPLKKGSKGDNVYALQQALISKYGKEFLPKYGADGQFGSEVVAALKKIGLPATVSESTFNVLVEGSTADKSSIGKKIVDATEKRDFSTVLNLLKMLSSKDDYRKASDQFSSYRINGGVRQTLVNGLLTSFSSDDQKQKIRYEFARMGLRYDGNKWSLDGVDSKALISKEPATVWINPKKSVTVPAGTVLGNEVAQKLDYTVFENNGKFFLVNSKSITYL